MGKIYQVKRNGQIFNPESLYLFQSTHYFEEIVKIKNEFDRQNINYVFLKGLPLHLYFEKTHPKRIYLDCDVLVAPRDFDKAQKILFQLGYKKAQTELTPQHEKLKDKQIENAYYKIINGFSVVFDLHLEVVFMMTQLGRLEALYPQKLIDRLTGEFLKTKRQVKINNEFFWILNTKYLILYLALHFFHHNFGGGFRLAFLDRIIRKVCQSEFTWTSQPKIFKQVQDEILRYQLQNFLYPV
ncbi:MAG: nucleotidyltransferase family protein, partial [Candidatus Omnitrophica bacterium]|nr:nucleotidyltransferase family protein [Candidatus Omnitrophota bacterium]